ncbi:PREDICTED: 3-ketoacyl-CoA synthase 7 [Theobroma cacao]|uniref:3-ketoacyl-CoA synthase n=1 Tax=Theobroma cacao TaxID=3641 RepID=A0AB32VAI1_THECC|nr:PREDICTED: 3-ketoacyl-CoA synthase 7 [Theobroma cacao]
MDPLPLPELKQDSVSNTIGIFLSTVLSKHLYSIPLELLPFSTLILAFMSLEGLFVFHKWEPIFHVLLLFSFLLLFLLGIGPFAFKPSSVYLVDFSCFKPPNCCKVPFSHFTEHASMIESFDSESVEFMAKILASSGLSEDTYLPPALHCIPPKTHQREYVKEAEMVLFPLMDDLLSKAKLSPRDIDILIINCSGFCPSPSLSSIIVNKYSMRSDVKSYSLSGMGCSAGAIGIDLAQNLLKTNRNSIAIVLSTEILSAGWYSGRERSMLLLNCLFRMGSAAVLLTNKKEASKSSKYKLLRTLRTQTAFEDKAYLTVIREEDTRGKLGVTINKDLLQAAGEILRSHITILGSQILPFKAKLRHAISIIRMKFIKKSETIYMPSFKTAIQHFCLPTSGRAVIREIAKGLKLDERDIEAALMTLHRFGNQSSSSMWYELAYMEAKERVKEGDKVWLLGMGTGPKCNSFGLECVRPIVGESKKNPWSDCINLYPIEAVPSKSPA